jgi:hypothetical protein
MIVIPVIPVYAFMSWMEKTLPFITYLFPLPKIMSEKGGIYTVDSEAKKERKVMSLEKVELLDKSHRQ